jgi:hypothetical protein
MRHTYTYVLLELSPAAYAEIRAKLLAAGYQHAFDTDAGREVIDMHGIAVQAEEAAPWPVCVYCQQRHDTSVGCPAYVAWSQRCGMRSHAVGCDCRGMGRNR